MENTKDIIGKLLFISGIILLIYMVLSPLNNVFIHPDEYFTVGAIKFSYWDMITLTSHDAHPPIHYLILKTVLELLSALNLNFNQLYISKIVSIIPYALILIVSFTKLRKEYGWLTSGIFVFALGTMSKFFIWFLTVRMFSWGLFFLLMSFIYLKDVIDKSDRKSWILLTVFSVLSIFTHYFTALSLIVIYTCLFIYLFCFKQDEFKEEMKKFIKAIILGAILFSPWMTVLFSQIGGVGKRNWVAPQIDVFTLTKTFTIFITTNEFQILSLLSVIALIFFVLVSFNRYDKNPNSDNYYILSGMIVFLGTILISIIVTFIYKPMMADRYLIPVSSIMWLSISILIGKLDNKKLLTISLILVIILGVFGIGFIMSDSSQLYEKGIKQQNTFNDINNNSNGIVIINSGVGLWEFGSFLNNSEIYGPQIPNTFGLDMKIIHDHYNFTEKTQKELQNMSTKNNKDVYFIDAWGSFKLNNNTNLTEIGRVGGAHIYQVNK